MFHVRRLITQKNLIKINNSFINQSKHLYSNQTEANQTKANEPVVLSDTCVKRLKELYSSNKQYLRVIVDSGGCSGLEYKFSLDTKINPDDLVIEKEGAKLIVDKETIDYIKGATVDYYEELIRTGFRVINNPNSEQGCSCGSSFSIKI